MESERAQLGFRGPDSESGPKAMRLYKTQHGNLAFCIYPPFDDMRGVITHDAPNDGIALAIAGEASQRGYRIEVDLDGGATSLTPDQLDLVQNTLGLRAARAQVKPNYEAWVLESQPPVSATNSFEERQKLRGWDGPPVDPAP